MTTITLPPLLGRSNTPGAAPTSLSDGEVKIQQADGALFWRNAAGAVRQMLFPKRAPVSDTAYTIKASDTYVGISALTASRQLNLPAASAYPVGQHLTIADETGACSASVLATLVPAGSDKINGRASFILSTANIVVTLVSDGVSKWTAYAGLAIGANGAADGVTITPLSGAPRPIYATVRHPAVLDITRDLSCPYDGSVADVSGIFNDAVARVRAVSPTGGAVLANPGIYNTTHPIVGAPGVKIVTPGLGTVQIRRTGDYGPTFKWSGDATNGLALGCGIDGFWIFDWDHSMTAGNSGQHVIFDYCDRPIIGAMRYENGGGGLGLYSCSSARIGPQEGKFYDYPNDSTRTPGRVGIKVMQTLIPGVSYIGGDYCFEGQIEIAGSLSDNQTASLESCIFLGAGDGICFQGYTHLIYSGSSNLRILTSAGVQLTNVSFTKLFSDICGLNSIQIDGGGYVDGLDIAGKCTTLGSGKGFQGNYAIYAPAVLNRASIRLTQVTGFQQAVPVLLNTAGNGEVSVEVPRLTGKASWNIPASTGSEIYRDITVPGVRAGDDVRATTVPGDLAGCLLTAYVPNPDNVRVLLSSPYGSFPNLGTVTVYVEAARRFR